VIDEAAAVARCTSTPAEVVLQQRQWAGKAGELDQGAIHDGGDMPPDNQRPPPGEKGAARDEGNEEQMDDHYNVSASPMPQLVTCQDNRSIPQNRPRSKIGSRAMRDRVGRGRVAYAQRTSDQLILHGSQK
jgi:hypothetical protein